MASSWIERTKLFKSPARVTAGFLLRSRETKAAQKRHWQDACRKQSAQLKRQAEVIAEQKREIARLKRQVQQLQGEANRTPPALPLDPPLKGHGYGPRLVSLAVSLAQTTGFRAAERAMKIFLTGFWLKRTCPTSRRFAPGCSGWAWPP